MWITPVYNRYNLSHAHPLDFKRDKQRRYSILGMEKEDFEGRVEKMAWADI
jgi:hypothetical protein